MDDVSTVAFVRVDVQCTLVDLEVVLWDDAVERICAAG